MALPRQLRAEKKELPAQQALRAALSKAPFCVQANIELARALTDNNQAGYAQVHLERAAAAGMTPELQLDIAHNLRGQARYADAVIAFDLARSTSPENPRAWGQLIACLEMAGQPDRAAEVFAEACIKFVPLPPGIRRPGAVVLAHTDLARAIALLQGEDLLPLELLDRGRYKEKLGDYAGAWADWTLAKSRLADKQGHIYWREHFIELFSGLFEISQPARYKMFKPVEDRALPGPVFVSGFARSGTTLVETILSQHSQVVAGDELMGINDCVLGLRRFARAGENYPLALMATTLGDNAETLPLLQQLYLKNSIARIEPPDGTILFTDKMPLNEIHLPLIQLLFPCQPFVYVRRHPLDIIISHMGHLLPNGGHYAQSLETVAEHYAGVDALLQHYYRVLPRENIFELRYEMLVREPESTIRLLAQHCGLTLETEIEAMLEPHTNPRNARTISYNQVRQPLNDRSIGRWRNFAHYLKPVLPIIEPICRREGYDI